jgi:hypothetical protein
LLSVQWELSCSMLMDRWTDIHTLMKLIVAFYNFVNVPKTTLLTDFFKTRFMLNPTDLRSLPPNINIYIWSILLTCSSRQPCVLDTVMSSPVINIHCLTFVCFFMETHQFVKWFYVYCFLGAFTKFQKVLASSYVCPPAWNNVASTGWIFMKSDIWVFFGYLSRKLSSIKVWER